VSDTTGTQAMTAKERDELRKLLNARARVAKQMVAQRAAELRADFEEQLAARYDFGHAAWADLTTEAARVVKEADLALAERCRLLGIPENFRPRLTVSWWQRGENANKERQVELRRVATTRLEALCQAARLAIDKRTLEGQTLLTHAGLTSEAAREFLNALPTPVALMPALDLAELDSAYPTKAIPEPTAEDVAPW